MDISALPDGDFDTGSFRDPASRVFHRDGTVFRALSDTGLAAWRALRTAAPYESWVDSGRLIASEEVATDRGIVLQHEKIPFWSYPYEWSFSMLRDAALLQLELLEEALAAGLNIKDATPYNIQFVGSSPIFIDVGSFEKYESGEPWLGYRQFCQQFLYPLLLSSHAGVPFQPLLRGSLDGISAPTAREFLRSRRSLKPGVLADVVLPARAGDKTGARSIRSELSSAGFDERIILANVRRLQRTIGKLEWSPDGSTWSEYSTCEHVAGHRSLKTEFVLRAAAQRRHGLIWDLGANDGHFARSVADHADTVVAIDGDEATVETLYSSLRHEGPTNVLPLVMNLSDPSPGLGWRGAERKSLGDRTRPGLTLMLAVLHHLVISANLPLRSVVSWLASLDSAVVLEWVPLDDPMSQQLSTNKRRNEIHADYDETSLRRYLDESFTIISEQPLDARRLFHLVPAT